MVSKGLKDQVRDQVWHNITLLNRYWVFRQLRVQVEDQVMVQVRNQVLFKLTRKIKEDHETFLSEITL